LESNSKYFLLAPIGSWNLSWSIWSSGLPICGNCGPKIEFIAIPLISVANLMLVNPSPLFDPGPPP